MKGIYEINSGIIIAVIPDFQSIEDTFHHSDPSFVAILREIPLPIGISRYATYSYCIVDGVLRRANEEIFREIEKYDRVLSEEERADDRKIRSLKPSYEEVLKAQNNIEMINLIYEVI